MKSGGPTGLRSKDDLLGRGTEDHYVDTDLYDFEYADRADDIAWYRAIATRCSRDLPSEGRLEVLELGAGTGRITLPLVRDGHLVLALDRMGPMLEALRANLREQGSEDAVRVLQADMRQIPLQDGSVYLVIAPFNALMHLYTWRDLLACFREVARVLVSGGTFAFDVQLPDLEWLQLDPNQRHAVTRFTHPRTGERLVYSTNHTYDAATQVCHIRIYYDEAPRSGRRFQPPPRPKHLVHLAHRQIFPEELRLLLDAAGLELHSHTGDFRDDPLRASGESQCVIARKPASR